MKLIIAILLTALLFACQQKQPVIATEDTDREILFSLNKEYDSALVHADTALLNKLYGSEFSYTTTSGELRIRADQLKTLADGQLILEFGNSDEVAIKIYNQTAILTGRFTGKGVFRGTTIDIKERYTTVWVKGETGWKLVKEQGTLIQ